MREQERLRQQLTRSEKLALIGELAATVAHEVNNPLDGLQNSTRIIRRNLDNVDQTRQLLDMMDAGLYRIEMIVRRLLAMSRDEAINPVPTRMDEIVSDAIVFVQPKFNRRSIKLVREFPDPTPFAMADRNQFVQALINLMINAADSMRDGGTLTLACRPDDESRTVHLEVRDSGSGIDEEHLPHIFEPFYTTKGKGSGTGLGLAVVARVIEAHQGKIDVKSTPGEGTTFIIELPAAAQQLQPADRQESTAEMANE
jgi:signal transduction histidine kinase